MSRFDSKIKVPMIILSNCNEEHKGRAFIFGVKISIF